MKINLVYGTAEVSSKEVINLAMELNGEVIEFPENGLHPTHVANLLDSYLEDGKDLTIVTYSEMLLLRLMRRIKRGEVNHANAKVFQVWRGVNDSTKIILSDRRFDEEGEMIDHWNNGFFEEGFNERFEINKLNTLKGY